MADRIITVQKITVQVATGDTSYQAEDGFSSIFAELAPDDANLQRQLAQVQKNDIVVTLRCAMLDVTGKITNSISENGAVLFVLSIDDMTYRKPGEA